jgi:hypothetical protein
MTEPNECIVEAIYGSCMCALQWRGQNSRSLSLEYIIFVLCEIDYLKKLIKIEVNDRI